MTVMQRFSGEVPIHHNGRRFDIAFSDSAPTEAPPAISLHGWGCSKTDLDPIAEQLAAEDLRIVTFTYPDRAKLATADRVEIARQIALARGLGRHAVIGHSMGGDDAVEYANAHANVVAIADVVGNHEISDRFFTGHVAAQPEDVFARDDTFNEYVAPLVTHANEGVRRYAHRVAAFDEEQRRAYHAAAVESMQRAQNGGTLQQLLGFAGIKFYIHGDAERHVYLPRLQQHKDITVVTVPHADHFLHVDNPSGYTNALRQFMHAVREYSQ